LLERASVLETLLLLEAQGFAGFLTRRIYRHVNGSRYLWLARHHRKGLLPAESEELREVLCRLTSAFWIPRDLNWWIGMVFSLGAALFAAGSVIALLPYIGTHYPQLADQIFFVGSIPFTCAAYLQLFQAANAADDPEHPQEKPRWYRLFGWRPHELGWQSCVYQFVGTLLFNFSTYSAMHVDGNWLQQDIAVWSPNFVGSVLFLISGFQAFVEGCHALWVWRPRSLTWWIVGWNLIGCLAFMASAFFAFTPPEPLPFPTSSISVVLTGLGALGFLVGSLLMVVEAAGPKVEKALGLLSKLAEVE